MLEKTLGDNSFVKFYEDKNSFSGGFSVAMFEATLVGLSKNIETLQKVSPDEMKSFMKEICVDEKFKEATKHGTRALKRAQMLNELSNEFFSGIANDKKR